MEKIDSEIEIFSYRAEMNKLTINFKGQKEEELCICTHIMCNHHLYELGWIKLKWTGIGRTKI